MTHLYRYDTSHIYLSLQPLFQLLERLAPMGDFVLLGLGHFSVSLAFILEGCIPS